MVGAEVRKMHQEGLSPLVRTSQEGGESSAARRIQVQLSSGGHHQASDCFDTSLAATAPSIPDGYCGYSMAVMWSPGLQDQEVIFCF